MNSLAMRFATKVYEHCPKILPDIFADATEETIQKIPMKIGPAISTEGPKLADVAKKSLFNRARESFAYGYSVPSNDEKDFAPLYESTYMYATTPSKDRLFKFANLNQGEKGISSIGPCTTLCNNVAVNTTSVAKKSLFHLAREKLVESVRIPFRSNGSMGQIFQKLLPFSDLPPLTVPKDLPTVPKNMLVQSAPNSTPIVQDPSTTNILDGFSGKKLSWEKHAKLFPKHRFGAIGKFFSEFTESLPRLPNNQPPKPKLFFEGYGTMGQKFRRPDISQANESHYVSATTPSKHTLFNIANLNQGEKEISPIGSCSSLCDNALAANTPSVAKTSLFQLARETWAEGISFRTNNSMEQEFGLSNTPDTATQPKAIASETAQHMISSIHNAGAAPPPPQTNTSGDVPVGPSNPGTSLPPVAETPASWNNNLAFSSTTKVSKFFKEIGKGIVTFPARTLGLLPTQAPSDSSPPQADKVPRIISESPNTSIIEEYWNDGTGESPPRDWFSTAKSAMSLAIRGGGGYVSEGPADSESGRALSSTTACSPKAPSPPQTTDKRGIIQQAVEGVSDFATRAFLKTAGTGLRLWWWSFRTSAIALVPDRCKDAAGKVSAGIDKIPAELRIPAVVFASLALIGAYSYLRRSRAAEPTDDDGQGHFPLSRQPSREQTPSMIEYQMLNQMAQLQAQLAQMQKASQLDGAKKQSAETNPQPAVIINKNRYYNSPPPEAVPEKPAKASAKKAKPGETSISLDVDYYNADGKKNTAASRSNQRGLTNNQEAQNGM